MDFQWVFFDFGKKISQVCWNSNLSVQRKKYQKNCWTICFSSFLDFDKKILYFCRKVFARVVKNTFDLSSGTLTEQDFRMQVLKTRVFLDNFWSFRDNGGTLLTLFSGLAKQQKMSAGTVYEKFFSKERKFDFFSDSVRLFTSSEIFRQSCETRNLCIRGSFWGKTVFEIYI